MGFLRTPSAPPPDPALEAQKKIIDLGFSDKEIIEMKSEELLLEYRKWRKDSGQ